MKRQSRKFFANQKNKKQKTKNKKIFAFFCHGFVTFLGFVCYYIEEMANLSNFYDYMCHFFHTFCKLFSKNHQKIVFYD